MLAIIPFIFTNPWIVMGMNFLITVAFWTGVAYLGGKFLGPDMPEADTGPTDDAQSRMWRPRTTQSEGIARPRAWGKNLHHGNIVARWTDVVDNREVLYMIVEHGEGPTKGIIYVNGTPQVFINDQPVGNFTSVDIQERLGTLNQTCMDGFEKHKDEYPQNIELLKDEPVIVTTHNDYFDDLEYTIMFPDGLLKYQKDGDRKTSTCHIKVRIREHPDGGWTEIFNEGISAHSLKPLFKPYTVSDLWDNVERGTQYDLEFTNLTGYSERHVNDVYLRSFREVVDIAFKRPGKALVGIRAVATAQLSGQLDVKVVREDRLINVWNGTSWNIEYSRNRAWVVWDALTQPVISGGDNIISNSNFSNWSGDDPVDWTVVGESGSDPEVSEVGTGEGHGGTGTGLCNIYTSDGTNVRVQQTVALIVGREYKVSLNINHIVTGGIVVISNSGMFPAKYYGTIGTKTWTFVATGTSDEIRIHRRQAGQAADVTIDDVSVVPFFAIEHYEGFSPAYLDLDFFYAWAEFCSTQKPSGYPEPDDEEDRLACDTILDFHTSVWEFVKELASIGRANLYWSDTLTGWIDTTVAAVSGLVTMDSVMARSWKNAWSEKSELAGKVEVFFQDSRQGYERMPAVLPNESAGSYTNIISIEGVGITTRGTAIHVANHALKRNELIRNVNSFRQYKDGFRYKPGNTINIQHKTPDWGSGYRVVKSTAANKVTLDRTCTAEVDDLIFMQSYDTALKKVRVDSYTVLSVAGKVVTITTNWDVTPVKNYMCAIGADGDIQTRRITKMELRSDNYFDITVETYDVALFTADDMVPDNPAQSYIWDKPANPLTRPVTYAEMIEAMHTVMVPQPDTDAPQTSNCTWTGSGGDTVSWGKTDATEAIQFRYKGTTFEITPDGTTDEFIYWDPNFTTTFRHTNDASVAVAMTGAGQRWMMCRNVAGVAYPTIAFPSVHGGVIQVGTITAGYGQLADLVVTTAKIADLAVETLKIKDDAVTLMVAAYTAGQLDYNDDNWHEAQTITMITTGAPVALWAGVQWRNNGANGCYIRVQRDDSVTVYQTNIFSVAQFGNPFCVPITDEPDAGEHTYDLDIRTTEADPTQEYIRFQHRSIVGQEVKK